MWCETPSFEKNGAKKVEVRVSINKQDYTIQGSAFTYYLNTKAEKTLAFGPGLLKDNAIKTETMFYIQARNLNNQNRESGADEFVISIFRPDIMTLLEQERERLQNLERLRIEEEKKKVPKKDQDEDRAAADEDHENQDEQGEEHHEVVVTKTLEEELEEKSNIPFIVEDQDDGSYIVKYTVDEPCDVKIII